MAKSIGGRPHITAPDAVAKADRQRQALELRMQGLTTPEIARRIGVSRQTAWAYVAEALASTREEIAEHGAELRAIEVRKIEGHLAHLREGLEAGDPAAHRAALGWHQHLAKLQGLQLQVEAAPGPQVIVVDARRPWERGDVVDGEYTDVPQLGAGGEPGGDEPTED